jgi:hypothetical protein
VRPLILLIGLLLAPFTLADSEVPRVEPWTLPDQFDRPYSVDGSERVMLIAASHGAAKLVDEAIKSRPPGWLSERSVIYVADISQIPRFVANRVLVPSMRSANYRVLLDRDDQVASRHVEDRGPVHWLTLEQGQIVERLRFDSSKTLGVALDALMVTEAPADVEPASD